MHALKFKVLVVCSICSVPALASSRVKTSVRTGIFGSAAASPNKVLRLAAATPSRNDVVTCLKKS